MTQRPAPHIRGLWCATLTPVGRDGAIDNARFVAHSRWLFSQGVDGIAPFGTTGEGASFATAERRAGLEALLAGGIPGAKIVAGTGCASLPETVELTKHATAAGAAACLVLPPFFWKDVSDDGVFAWYAQLIERAADPRLKIFLYHLPQFSAVPLSVDLVARLAAAFPGVIVGVKDSEGNWAHTSALLERVPQLTIVIGHEPHLPKLLRAGGAGTICGVANNQPGLVRALLSPAAGAADEARILKFIDIAFRQPFIAGFKSMAADRYGDPDWCHVRAPLVALSPAQRSVLRDALDAAGFGAHSAQVQQ
ncbi:MAG: dihydrodipicolinate synthase family protein [Burkholderiales bacterium]